MKVPDDVAVAGFGNARDVKPRGAETDHGGITVPQDGDLRCQTAV